MRRTTRPRSDNDVVCLFFCCIISSFPLENLFILKAVYDCIRLFFCIVEGEVTGGEVQWGHLDAAIAVSSCFKPFPFVDILQIGVVYGLHISHSKDLHFYIPPFIS